MASVSSASPALSPPRSGAGAGASLPHPAVWRASQISGGQGSCIDTGHAALSAELPGQGWPQGALIELLVQQPGIGEITLLRPALEALPADRSIVLVQPPYVPNITGWPEGRHNPARLLWVRPQSQADALWATDQALKSGSCAAVMCWLPQVPANALRRLHGAAQAADVLFVVLRPWQAAQQTSPAPLRLALQPAPGGLLVHFIKRRGPLRDAPLHISLFGNSSAAAASSFSTRFSHAFMDSHSSLPAKSGRIAGAHV